MYRESAQTAVAAVSCHSSPSPVLKHKPSLGHGIVSECSSAAPALPVPVSVSLQYIQEYWPQCHGTVHGSARGERGGGGHVPGLHGDPSIRTRPSAEQLIGTHDVSGLE